MEVTDPNLSDFFEATEQLSEIKDLAASSSDERTRALFEEAALTQFEIVSKIAGQASVKEHFRNVMQEVSLYRQELEELRKLQAQGLLESAKLQALEDELAADTDIQTAVMFEKLFLADDQTADGYSSDQLNQESVPVASKQIIRGPERTLTLGDRHIQLTHEEEQILLGLDTGRLQSRNQVVDENFFREVVDSKKSAHFTGHLNALATKLKLLTGTDCVVKNGYTRARKYGLAEIEVTASDETETESELAQPSHNRRSDIEKAAVIDEARHKRDANKTRGGHQRLGHVGQVEGRQQSTHPDTTVLEEAETALKVLDRGPTRSDQELFYGVYGYMPADEELDAFRARMTLVVNSNSRYTEYIVEGVHRYTRRSHEAV